MFKALHLSTDELARVQQLAHAVGEVNPAYVSLRIGLFPIGAARSVDFVMDQAKRLSVEVAIRGGDFYAKEYESIEHLLQEHELSKSCDALAEA